MYSQNTNPFNFSGILPPVRRTVFISHYEKDDDEVEDFLTDFKGVFIPKIIGVRDNDAFINSPDTNYVMHQIRERYIGDSTVTIVLIGKCTHSRRYIDWEIKSSLTQGDNIPNGLIGILLPSQGNSAYLPPRFSDNYNSGYATYHYYPETKEDLREWIEDAYEARTLRANQIINSQEMMKYNHRCSVCNIVH